MSSWLIEFTLGHFLLQASAVLLSCLLLFSSGNGAFITAPGLHTHELISKVKRTSYLTEKSARMTTFYPPCSVNNTHLRLLLKTCKLSPGHWARLISDDSPLWTGCHYLFWKVSQGQSRWILQLFSSSQLNETPWRRACELLHVPRVVAVSVLSIIYASFNKEEPFCGFPVCKT